MPRLLLRLLRRSCSLIAMAIIIAIVGVASDARAGQPPAATTAAATSTTTASATAAGPGLFRIFLKDGTALASRGEFARVGERVIFSLPLGVGREQLTSVRATEIDWKKTDSYTDAVRAAHYAETRGEAEYARMSAQVAAMLTEIAQLNQPSDLRRQMTLATEARKMLVEWPKEHFGYKADEVHQTLGVLDQVIAGLRARAGEGSFDLSLVAGSAPPMPVPLMEPPSLQDSIAQALRLAELEDSATERVSLLRNVDAVLKDPAWVAAPASAAAPAGATTAGTAAGLAATSTASASAPASASPATVTPAPVLPEAWRALTRAKVREALASETRTDSAYASLVTTILAAAERKGARADVRGLTELRGDLQKRDERLGRKRPEQMQALLATLDQRLDAARRLRLARDQWTIKSGAFRAYQKSIKPSVDALTRGTALLNDIRALAGPSLEALTRFEARLAAVRPALQVITVPPDLRDAHASLLSAWQMTEAAIHQRARAIADNKMNVAWDASAAAAGALMLFEHARTELARMMKAPDTP